MRYAVIIGTVSARTADSAGPGEVLYEGKLPKFPIWDAALNNIREMNAAELAAEQAIEDGKLADADDLRARVAAALTRLNDIITNGPTYTNAQVRAAVVDMAQMLHAIIRDLRHRL